MPEEVRPRGWVTLKSGGRDGNCRKRTQGTRSGSAGGEKTVCLSEVQGEAGRRSVQVKARRTWDAESVMCWVSLRQHQPLMNMIIG